MLVTLKRDLISLHMRLVERDVWVDWDFASIYLFILFVVVESLFTLVDNLEP